jgi:hypothetical protein
MLRTKRTRSTQRPQSSNSGLAVQVICCRTYVRGMSHVQLASLPGPLTPCIYRLPSSIDSIDTRVLLPIPWHTFNTILLPRIVLDRGVRSPTRGKHSAKCIVTRACTPDCAYSHSLSRLQSIKSLCKKQVTYEALPHEEYSLRDEENLAVVDTGGGHAASSQTRRSAFTART